MEMEIDSYAQLVKEVTVRVDDDGDLSALDQFFVWDGDWNLLYAMPLSEAYAIVKLVIRSGYDFRLPGYNDCTALFPHMISPFYHSGMEFKKIWNQSAYSNNVLLILEESTSPDFARNALAVHANNVGDYDDTGIFSLFCVVEFSFRITLLIERGTER